MVGGTADRAIKGACWTDAGVEAEAGLEAEAEVEATSVAGGFATGCPYIPCPPMNCMDGGRPIMDDMPMENGPNGFA